MSLQRLALGRRAEEAAAEYLARNRHRILERNFRCAAGEIDLVSTVGDLLVFVEVRSRTRADYGRGIETVDRRKQLRIRQAAEAFLYARRLGEVSVRFDVIGVEWRGDTPVIDHIENAF
ncbi:MAG: YraN family protein [Candidatus Binatia bacterium]